ncbi:MAG: hypothetical protein AAF291_05270 [Pseudomonadota bacterium]
MGESRIDRALARIEAALARMDAAHASALAAASTKPASDHAATSEKDTAGSARVMELVNAHEKLREEVADTLRDLDGLIDELEG